MRNRVITALVLIPVVVMAVFWLDTRALGILFGLIVIAGAAEMARLGGCRDGVGRWAFLGLFAAAVVLLLLRMPVLPFVLLGLLAAWWVVQTGLLVGRRRALVEHTGRRPLVLALGAVLLLLAWISLLMLHAREEGPWLVLFLLVMIWSADSGAYFAGRAFGRHKLSPQVSPGKTWEGVAGGVLGALACALVLAASGLLHGVSVVLLVAVCIVTALVSVGGDLWESRLKREAALKDSGQLLPGHGGVLDRIDSLIAAAPTFAFGLELLEVTG